MDDDTQGDSKTEPKCEPKSEPKGEPKGEPERDPKVEEGLRGAGQLMVLLAQHLDRAKDAGMDEIGRAWVRAAHLERLLRELLPPGATDEQARAEPTAPAEGAPSA